MLSVPRSRQLHLGPGQKPLADGVLVNARRTVITDCAFDVAAGALARGSSTGAGGPGMGEGGPHP
jgi:hypothetical protein